MMLMPEPYRGEHDGTTYLLKRPLEGNRQALESEAQFLKALRHPRLPRCYGYHDDFLCLDYVEGIDSEEYVHRRR